MRLCVVGASGEAKKKKPSSPGHRREEEGTQVNQQSAKEKSKKVCGVTLKKRQK